ncbi:MAG: hypothetical protein IJ324_08490 [Lachnospiraceae bacterium]|nr:hypothetical protein [Lachnospiraceae bacterium]
MEILLLVVGAVVFILSFVIPVKKEDSEEVLGLAKEEIRELIAGEMSQIKGQVDDTVDEAIIYAMEKTERSLERLSNEKIMAVSEYSDTVLSEINKNHQEVMFLYDMLNDKHTNLKNTVSEVDKTAKEAEAAVKEAVKEVEKAKEVIPVFQALNVNAEHLTIREDVLAELNAQEEMAQPVVDERQAIANRNEAILALHRLGNSDVQIAKELGLGVGEVKLVIELFKE